MKSLVRWFYWQPISFKLINVTLSRIYAVESDCLNKLSALVKQLDDSILSSDELIKVR